MKKSVKWIIVSLSALMVMSFVSNDELFNKLGCDEGTAKDIITQNLIYGNLYYPVCGGVYKKIAETERVAVVNMLYSYIREVVKSESFKQKYAEEHLAVKPQEPVKENVQKMDDSQAQMVKAIEEQMNNPYLTEDQKVEMKKNLEEMKKQFEQPDMKAQMGQMDEMAAKGAEEKYQKDMVQYKSDMAEWEKMNDFNYMIKSRLKAFLDLTANIDFNAKLVQSGKRMMFENPDYEAKDYYWKACYRCGPVAIKQARLKAFEWLNELK